MKKTMISEVIDGLGISRFTFLIYILVGLTLLFDGFDYMIVAYTMPQISKEWALTKVQTGSLASWGMLGLMIGGLAAGVISDRLGRKKALILGCLVYSLLTLPIYFAPNYETFAILRILSGMGLGACIPVSVTMISEFAPTKNRGLFSSSIMMFYLLGWVMAGIMAIYVVPAYGWRVCYLIGGLPAFYAIVLAAKLIESPHWLLSQGREKEAIDVIKKMEIAVKGEAGEWTPGSIIAPPPPKSVGVKAILSREYRSSTITLWTMYFFGLIIVYGVTGWMPSLLVAKGYGLVKGYSFAVLQNLFSIIGALSTGYIADIIGRRKNIIFAYVFTAVSVILLGLASNQWTVVIFSVLVGIAMNYGQSGLMPLLTEAYRTEFRNTGVAWTQGFARLGGFCGPIVVGWIQQIGLGFTGVFLFFTVPAVICVLCGIFFVKETKGKKMEEFANVSA